MRLLQCLIVAVTCGLFATVATAGTAISERNHVIAPADYFELTGLGNLALSPTGRHAAYTESRWGEGDAGRLRDLWVVDLDGGHPRRLTFDNFGVRDPVWASDGRTIYFLGRDRGGRDSPPHDGSTQIWRVLADGSDLRAVTRVEDGVGTFQLAPDGDAVIYTVVAEETDEAWREIREKYDGLDYGHGIRRLTEVRQLDLVSWRDHQVLPPTRVIWEMTLSPDGRQLGLITTDDNELIFMEGWSRVEVVDLADGTTTPVTGHHWRNSHPSPFGWLEDLTWSRDGRALAFSIAYDGYATRIWAAEADGDDWSLQLVERPDQVHYAGGLQWRGSGRTLSYRGERHGRIHVQETAGVESGEQGRSRSLTEGDAVVGAFAFDSRGKNLTVIMETPVDGNDIYTVDGKGDFTRRTRVNPQIDSWQLPTISHVSWTGADGDECFGILELPYGYRKGDGPLPAVVLLHGGPTSSTKFRFRHWGYGRALMPANGYALLSPNYHGSTGYGDEFLEKLIGRENEIEVTDITLGTRWLIDEGIADSARIGVMGWSNGGYLTNCMIVAEPDMYAAASSGAGVLDMVIQWGTEDTPGHVINYTTGLPWEEPEHYRAASPLYGLDKVRTPTLIHVGGNDARVPPAHSRALYRALRHYVDVDTELIVYPNEPHGLTTRRNRLAKMEWDLAWFEKYLMGLDD